MAAFNVELLPAANEDLNEIFDYLLMENPLAAEDVLEKMMSALTQLKTFPYSGIKITEDSLARFQFRMIVTQPYLVFYRFVDDQVLIYRVLHEARDVLNILKK